MAPGPSFTWGQVWVAGGSLLEAAGLSNSLGAVRDAAAGGARAALVVLLVQKKNKQEHPVSENLNNRGVALACKRSICSSALLYGGKVHISNWGSIRRVPLFLCPPSHQTFPLTLLPSPFNSHLHGLYK